MTAFPSSPSGRPITASAIAPGWRPALTLIGLASLVFAVAFRDDIGGAVRVWTESTAYNHCFLIIPLVAFLLWERRTIIASTSPRPSFWPLVLMPLLSAAWLVAAILDIQEGRQLMLVAMFQVVLLAALGPRLVWSLLAPLLFLSFLVPSGAFLVPSLQKITADISVAGLQLLHIPVFSDGFMIEIPEGTFEIAEACAGLRFLIASIVFGCFFAVVMYRSYLRRCLFIGLSLVVPIAANGMRALGIIVLAHLEGSAAAVEADHVLYGWLFFTLVIMILIAIGMTFSQRPERSPVIASSGWSKSPTWRFALATSVAISLALAGPAYAALLNAVYPQASLPDVQPPLVRPPWQIVPASSTDWRPEVSGADRQFLDSFKEPNSEVVTRFVGVYRLRAIGNALTKTGNRLVDDSTWHIAGYGHAETVLGGKQTAVASTEIVSGQRHRLVWSFYVVDGKISVGLIETKRLQAGAVLFAQAPTAAFVAISASMDNPNDPAERQLMRFLAATQPLPQYLAALRR